ncbi:MAG: hypothetical protein MJZ27_01835 [Bacteroidales bacterium]|nr:hypothetical protein [Bacteroidales bacterium]
MAKKDPYSLEKAVSEETVTLLKIAGMRQASMYINGTNDTACPTLEDAVNWLRDKKKLVLDVDSYGGSGCAGGGLYNRRHWQYKVFNADDRVILEEDGISTFSRVIDEAIAASCRYLRVNGE